MSPAHKASPKAWWNHFTFGQRAKKESTLVREYEKGSSADHPVFGKPLIESLKCASTSISTENQVGDLYVWGYVPVVIAKCGLYLKENATEVADTFRINGVERHMRELQQRFEASPKYGKDLDWTQETYTTHDVASVFRRYLTQMPEPIIPHELYHKFRDALAKEPYKTDAVISEYKALVRQMTQAHQYLLLYVLDLLSVFARKSDRNLMTAQNLAVIFRPCILSHPTHEKAPAEHALSQRVLVFLIANQDWFMLDIPTPNLSLVSPPLSSSSNRTASSAHGHIQTPSSIPITTTGAVGVRRSRTLPSRSRGSGGAGGSKPPNPNVTVAATTHQTHNAVSSSRKIDKASTDKSSRPDLFQAPANPIEKKNSRLPQIPIVYDDGDKNAGPVVERTSGRVARHLGNEIKPSTAPPPFSSTPTAAQVTVTSQHCNLLLSRLLTPGMLVGKEFIEKNLEKEDSQNLIDYLTKVLDDEIIIERDEVRRLLSFLVRLGKIKQVFPVARELKDVRCNFFVRPLFEGAFGCVFKGEYQGRAVAVKAPRLTELQDNSHNLKAQAREFALWSHLSHQNIVPFYGIYLSEETAPRICIVSPWMENGNLNAYLKSSPDVPRVPLLLDVMKGLKYLHQLTIVHTDLKGANILVSRAGRAMITDFGISSIAVTLQTMTAGSTGTLYWIAPEVLVGTNPPSLESDIWSYGCVSYEVFTGKRPFYQYTHQYSMIGLMKAFRDDKATPTRPTAQEAHAQLTDKIWQFMMKCWDYRPEKRPTPKKIISFFQSLNVPDSRPSAENDHITTASVKATRPQTVTDYGRIYGILNRLYEAQQKFDNFGALPD